MMNVLRLCKRTTWLSICLVIFLSVIIVTSQAMTISREDLSQLFNGFLDKLEQQEDDQSAKVEEKARQVESHIIHEAEENPANISQRLSSILRELHHVEAGIENTRAAQPPTVVDKVENTAADTMLMELMNESRNMAHLNDGEMNDDSDDHYDHVVDVGQMENLNSTDRHDDSADLPHDNRNGEQLYDYAACELRLNERLAPLTLARYHRFRGTVNLRQNRSNGSREVLLRLFGLTPSNSNSQGHGVYIREFGDLRDGCQRLGPIFDTSSDADQLNGLSGMLGVVSPDGSGFVEYRSSEVEHFDLDGQNSVYGRSIVIEESPNTYGAPLGCCVIGVTRDGGEWM